MIKWIETGAQIGTGLFPFIFRNLNVLTRPLETDF